MKDKMKNRAASVGALTVLGIGGLAFVTLIFIAKVAFFYLLWLLCAWVFNLWFLESYIAPVKAYQIIAALCFLRAVFGTMNSK